jgi:hypothetical protein
MRGEIDGLILLDKDKGVAMLMLDLVEVGLVSFREVSGLIREI